MSRELVAQGIDVTVFAANVSDYIKRARIRNPSFMDT